MKQEINVLSVGEQQIILEKPADRKITSIQLVDELNGKVSLNFIEKSEELIVTMPLQQLEGKQTYQLYMNDQVTCMSRYCLIHRNKLVVEGDNTSFTLKLKEDLDLAAYSESLSGEAAVKNAQIEEKQLRLDMEEDQVNFSSKARVYAVNEENEESILLNFHYTDSTMVIPLQDTVTVGEWQLKIVYPFHDYLLIDDIVQGIPTKLNANYIVGQVKDEYENYTGAHFKNNHLCLLNLPKELYTENIPFNEKSDILIQDVISDHRDKKRLSFRLLDDELDTQILTEIVIMARKSKQRITVPFQVEDSSIVIEIDEEWLLDLAKERWDFYAEFLTMDNSIRRRLKVNREESEKLIYMYTHTEQDAMIIYTTSNNFLSLYKAASYTVFKEKHRVKTKMVDLVKDGNTGFTLAVEVKTEADLDIKGIVIKLRSQDTSRLLVLEPLEIHPKDEQTSIVKASYQVNWDKDFFPLYWDVFITAEDNDNVTDLIKVTSAKNKLKQKINKDYLNHAVFTDDKIMYPYVTLKREIAFMMRDKEFYENKKTKFKEKLAYFTHIALKPFYFRKKEIWIGFEKFSSTAQDNGYAFFQYVDKNKLHDNFYYILDKNSSDYDEVSKESKKIIPFMSFKYFVMLFASDLLVSSENKRHVYNLRVRSGLVPRKIAGKQSVFLQHGVTALKQSNVFKKAKGRGNFSLVIATSDMEKEIIHQHWKYELNEIAVTGFSRWDKLIDKSSNQERRKIFVMPTWRTWMEDMPAEDFKKTDYYDNYVNFLNSKELEEILVRHQLELVFFLHPKFKQYVSEFQLGNEHVQLKEFQNIKVNEEIMEASMMISDYSSVTWDMFYLKKPVAFFQFDYEKYNEYEGSYIDMEQELFGDRAVNKDELVTLISEYANNNFQMKPDYQRLHHEYFKYVDHHNSERIFNVIKRLK
ncbi:CDP-glycerol glycerophosphotransferase family protein [Gracilibacillus alcaliphilus]|uniref:CDP-glycerol glycerophosphotransferase family protein n=1 Tax=Gracilibacillus alcaliphilus TaxID=1401441 RepID=UPI00195854A4|nr:CDP-glycerol glycerophosphotransferase family protein [Gracilibacillus alcaliphilus]MBM7678414.1 CDP-glycerol glycerophosphotransferase (TagB/SpsB family) [Gracilibacillus alcaliphilus]